MPHLDFTQPPFDVLSLAERQSIRKNTKIRYLARDEILPAADLSNHWVVNLSPLIWAATILMSQTIMTGLIVAAYLSHS